MWVGCINAYGRVLIRGLVLINDMFYSSQLTNYRIRILCNHFVLTCDNKAIMA